MQTKIQVSAGEIGKGLPAVSCKLAYFPQCVLVSTTDGGLIRFEVRVAGHDANVLRRRFDR